MTPPPSPRPITDDGPTQEEIDAVWRAGTRALLQRLAAEAAPKPIAPIRPVALARKAS